MQTSSKGWKNWRKAIMRYPRLFRIRQRLDDTRVKDIETTIRSELDRIHMSSKIKPGSKVAVTAGSRGITDIVSITSSIVKEIKGCGASPFIVSAMGSHGGASARGQMEILEEYGLTEEKLGVPIVSSIDVVKIGETAHGIPVYIDQKAFEADHIVVVNRIKAHTEFHGHIESGLIKMMVIGLGNHQGAVTAHRFAVRYGYEKTLTEIGEFILQRAPIALGIGVIENGFGQTAHIVAIPREDFLEKEKELLKMAKEKTARLPFEDVDILIVDKCGKEISGTGMDTKVIGRVMNIYETEVTSPRVTRIVLRDLSEKTHGNALGVGLADFVTKRLVEKIDHKATYINSITAVTPEKGRLPIVCENDREALDFALATAGPPDMDRIRIVWIRNTSRLSDMFVSQGMLAEAEAKENVEIDGEGDEMRFDRDGNLVEMW
jgi:hypothetical protein